MLNSIKKRKLWLAVLVVIAVLIIFVLNLLFSPATINYITAPVTKGDLEEAVLATGVLEAKQQVNVGAQVSGQLKTLHVKLGDKVQKGQLLAEIDPILQQNELENAQAALTDSLAQKQSKEAQLTQIRQQLKRQQEMYRAQATSQEDLQTAESNYKVAKSDLAALNARIQQARIQVSTAKANLGYTRISAPMDGTVVAVITKEGQTVVSAQAAPTILKLASLDTMTIKAQISEADVVRVNPGQEVYFTILGAPNRRFTAKLRAIEPAPDSISSDSTTTSSSSEAIYYNGLFDVPNPDGILRISMTAQVSIVLDRVKNVLLLPSAALGAQDKVGRYEVQVLKQDGNIELRKVKTGLNNNVNVQVLEGLKAGEQVVVGSSAMDDGTQTAQTHRGPPAR